MRLLCGGPVGFVCRGSGLSCRPILTAAPGVKLMYNPTLERLLAFPTVLQGGKVEYLGLNSNMQP